MAKEDKFQIIEKKISNTSDAPKGKEIYYRCLICGDAIPSIPKDNVGCKCGNVFIDIDYFRLAVKDFSNFQAVQKLSD